MNIIETKKLFFKYEDNIALDNINISFEKGKTTAVLGGNGAGKSTLFLNINGVLKPKSGEILFNGEKISYTKEGIKNIRGEIGIVFQDPDDQVFSASVKKDIAFGPYNLGLSKEEIEKRVEKAMIETGIKHLENKPVHALSFGQKKRVAIAGILVMEPKVIILDEPTAGLDPKGVSEILSLLNKIKKEKDVTLIIATHEIDIVPVYCDRALILNSGKAVFEGSVEEMFKNPNLLRENNLRLPRIEHLMEILNKKDNINVNPTASTISKARETIKSLLGM